MSDEPQPEVPETPEITEKPNSNLYIGPKVSRDQLARKVRAELGQNHLEPWQQELCLWLAIQPYPAKYLDGHKITTSLVRIACALAERVVKRKEIYALTKKAVWIKLWEKERAGMDEHILRKAREQAISMIPRGLRTYDKSLRKVEEKLDDPNNPDPIGAVRAATPLVTPLLERALPKKDEHTQQAAITVVLNTSQTRQIDATAFVVEAQELPPQDVQVIE